MKSKNYRKKLNEIDVTSKNGNLHYAINRYSRNQYLSCLVTTPKLIEQGT